MATRNIVPRGNADGGQIGTSSKVWSDGYFSQMHVGTYLLKIANFFNTSDLTTTGQSLTNATGFSWAIAANETWVFDFALKVGSSSATGLEFGFTFPASGVSFLGLCFGTLGSSTAYQTDTITVTATAGIAFNTASITTAAAHAFMRINGSISNGAAAGNVQLQFLKVTSGTASIYTGSTMTARRVA